MSDAELDIWREQWQSETAVPADLRRRVERQSRAMRWGRVADGFVTIVIGGIATAWAVLSRQADVIVLAAATWLFIATAWAFGLAVNRGNWSPPALDAEAFMTLSIRRCRSALSKIRFGAILGACEFVFGLGWVYYHSPEPRLPVLAWLFFSSPPIDFVWIFAAAFFGFLFWYQRRKRMELAYLLQLRALA